MNIETWLGEKWRSLLFGLGFSDACPKCGGKLRQHGQSLDAVFDCPACGWGMLLGYRPYEDEKDNGV